MPQVNHGCERVLINANLITLDPQRDGAYGVMERAALLIADGRIAAIRSMDEWPATTLNTDGIEVVDLAGQWISPGFVDCHTHLVFAGNRAAEFEQRLLGVPYETIARQGGGILSTVRATRQAEVEELVAAARPRLLALMREGVTTIEIKSGYGLTLEDEIKLLRAARQLTADMPVNVSLTLLAAHAIPPEFQGKADDYVDMICQTLIPLVSEEKLADAVDVFCEGIAFSPVQCERVFQAAQAYGLAIKGHTEQLSLLGGTELVARYQGWSADHVEYLDEAGVAAMAEAGTVSVLLPGAFYFLREKTLPPIELLRKYRVPMAVATDFNPGTSPLASIRLMMNMACTLFRLTPEESLRGVTQHAATALGRSSQLGMLREGMQADLLVWNIRHPAELAYEFGVSQPTLRFWKGQLSEHEPDSKSI